MSRNNKKFLIYFAVIALPLLLFLTRPAVFTPAKFSVVEKTSFFPNLLSWPFREIKKLFYYQRTFNEYLKLRKEVSTLRGRLIGLEEVIQENSRLQNLLNMKRKLVYSSISATVIGRDPSNWNSSMIIDKGTNDGAAAGMPVVGAMGVVGKIAEAGPRMSKVILVNDPNFSVPALVQRPREMGLISGSLKGLCRLRYLSPNATVEVGDTVITSQISSSFPEGLLIGEVVGVENNPNNSTVECIVSPAAVLSQVEEVLVIQK